jgi:hypothetical protein
MLRFFAFGVAVATVVSASAVTLQAAPFKGSTSRTSGSTRGLGSALQSKAARNRSGALDARPGRRAGASPAFQLGSPESSGWYQHGFGGTGDPGWGYNFGPHLGGFGR